MITVINKGPINLYYGLSSDTKPSGKTLNGSMFLEIDTGKVFIFDGDGLQWVEQSN